MGDILGQEGDQGTLQRRYPQAFTVVGGMLIGMFLFQQVDKLRARRAEKKQASPNGQPEKAVS